MSSRSASLTFARVIRRAQDLVLGVDAFISYRHIDGKVYAVGLQSELERKGWRVWRDDVELEAGPELTPAIVWALRRARMLVLVASPGTCEECWVHRERRVYRSRHLDRPIVAIDVGSSTQHEIWSDLGESLRLTESAAALASGVPSPDVIVRLLRARTAALRNMLGIALLVAVVVALVLLSTYLGIALLDARRQRDEALRQRHHSIALYLAREALDQDGDRALLLAAQGHLFNEAHAGPYRRNIDETLRSIYARPFRLQEIGTETDGQKRTWRLGNSGEFLLSARLDGPVQVSRPDASGRLYRDTAPSEMLDPAEWFDGTRPRLAWAHLAELTPRLVGGENWLCAGDRELVGHVSEVAVAGSTWLARLDDGRVVVRRGSSENVRVLVADEREAWQSPEIALSRSGSHAYVARWSMASDEYEDSQVVFEAFDLDDPASLPCRTFLETDMFESYGEVYVAPEDTYVMFTAYNAETSSTALIFELGETRESTEPLSLRIAGETIESVAFEASGRWLALGSRRWAIDGEPRATQVGVFDVHAALQGSFSSDTDAAYYFNLDFDSVSELRFSPNGELLAARDGTSLRVWRADWSESWRPVFSASKHTAPIGTFAWRNDLEIVSIDDNGHTLRWDLDSGRAQALPLEPPTDRWFSASDFHGLGSLDANGLFVTVADDRLVVFDLHDRSQFREIELDTDGGFDDVDGGFATDPRTQRVAVGVGGGRVACLDVADGKLRTLDLGCVGRTSMALQTSPPCVVAFDEEQTLRASLLDGDTETTFAHVETDTTLSAITAHPSGNWIALLGSDGRIERWSADAPTRRRAFAPPNGSTQCVIAEFSPSGRFVAVGDEEGGVFVLDGEGQLLETIAARRPSRVTALAFSADQRFLSVGCQDGWISVHELTRTSRPVEFDTGDSPLTGLAFERSGCQILSSSRWFSARGRDSSGALLVHQTLEGLIGMAGRDVWRNLTNDEWRRFVAIDLPYETTFDTEQVANNGR